MTYDSARAISGPAVPHDSVEDPVDRAEVRRTFTDPDRQAAFEGVGFAVVPFLDEAAIARVLEVWNELGPAPGDDQTGFYPGNASSSPDWKRAVIAEVTPIVASRIDALFDRHHIFHLTFMTKWPGVDGRLQPHQDSTMVDQEGRYHALNVWCPLNIVDQADADAKGLLRIVPGSQHLVTGSWYRARGGFIPAGIEDAEPAIYERLAQPIRVRPGEAIAFDHRVVHCSSPNTSSEPRLVLACGLRPAEVGNIHVDCTPEGEVVFYAVDDEYFIRHPDVDMTTYPEIRRVQRHESPVVTVDDVEQAAAAFTSPAPRERRDPGPRLRLTQRASGWPGWSWPFASRSGSTAGRVFQDPVLDHRLRRDGFVVLRGAVEHVDAGDHECSAQLARTLERVVVDAAMSGHEVLSSAGEHEAPLHLPNEPTRPMGDAVADRLQRGCIVLVALDDEVDHGGSVRVVRGSHRLPWSLASADEALRLVQRDVFEARFEALDLDAGDAVVADRGLVVSSFSTTPDAARRWFKVDVGSTIDPTHRPPVPPAIGGLSAGQLGRRLDWQPLVVWGRLRRRRP